MQVKLLEVCYDVHAISGRPGAGAALEFREAAMAHVGNAMRKADAGEWGSAEILRNAESGGLEVTFGFEVSDFDKAETVIRKAVEGTVFENIREIVRAVH